MPDAGTADHCRRIAAWLLGELGPAAHAAAPALQRLAAAPGPDSLHSLMVLALARIEPQNPVAFSNAAALLAGTNLYGRYYATLHLGALTNHPAMDPRILMPALSDTEGWNRANAAFSLAGFGPRARTAAPRLRELLHDPHPVVGANAAYALALVSPAEEAVAAAAFEAWVQRGEPAPTTVTQFFRSRGLREAPTTASRTSPPDQ